MEYTVLGAIVGGLVGGLGSGGVLNTQGPTTLAFALFGIFVGGVVTAGAVIADAVTRLARGPSAGGRGPSA